jgi:hypothetical protein
VWSKINGKHVVIALVLLSGIVAAGLACSALAGAGFYTAGPSNETVAITGTVAFVDLEDGFFGIIADDGRRYLPLDLPEAFARDGLAVTAEVTVRKDVATIQQWGTPVEIVAITSPGQAAGVTAP